ncbi:MAG: esterase-like activity of phytase family protein [Bacteroidaceae bacterium]|nr:esterase-like activity of phytase family protein [Prevotellaceae bacterium]MDY5631885.1 esterase-like activity of phytase family protein [Bacteroidaceae bacterium]
MKRIFPLFLILAVIQPSWAQIHLRKAQKLKRWHIPAANYSGITPLGNNRYALVSDKEDEDGFYEISVRQDSLTGKVIDASLIAFHGNGLPPRDAEGIAFCSQRGTLFISAEDDQRILEYDLQGRRTGHELNVPPIFALENIYPNYGFEALCHDALSNTFWATTENTLRTDGLPSTQTPAKSVTLRLQQFSAEGEALAQYPYQTDTPLLRGSKEMAAHGVVALTALSDGSLLVLEREILVTRKKLGSYALCRLYRWQPGAKKQMQAEWRTKLNLGRRNLANFEGLCPGIRLADGRQTILLISDSQGGYGNRLFRLKDYIKCVVM